MPSGSMLSQDEMRIAYEYHVGLYEGDIRCTLCDSGTLVLTSDRVLWIPGTLKEVLRSGSNIPTDTIWLELSDIIRVEKQV